jgi:hypothetical protein
LQFGIGFDILDQQNFERTVHGYGRYAPRFQFIACPSGTGKKTRRQHIRAPAGMQCCFFRFSIAAV